MRLRNLWLVAVTLLLVGAAIPIGIAALRDTGGFASYPSKRQAFAWSTYKLSTSGTEWRGMGIRGPVRTKGPSSVEVSINVSGAPIDVRVAWGPHAIFRPLAAHFDPSSGTTSFSYRFADHVERRGRCRYFDMQWRSPTGEKARVTHALAVLDYVPAPVGDHPMICE